MKFKFKLKKQSEKDFISKVEDNLKEVQNMISEANGIKEVLTKYMEVKDL